MKWLNVFLVLLLVISAAAAFADNNVLSDNFSSGSLGKWKPLSGKWKIIDGKLTQVDTSEKMAMIVVPGQQSGKVLYQFDVEYIGGGEDDYAGFGFHICINKPSSERSWGNGKSLLGWVAWDPEVYGPPGGFIQIYESKSNIKMGLYTKVFPDYDPIKYGNLLPISEEYLDVKYLDYRIPVKIMIDTSTGKGKFYDPLAPDDYYYDFDLGGPIKPGDYFAFRTNSVSLSLDNVSITSMN